MYWFCKDKIKMSLEQSLERQGNFLFKYRGQFPILLFFTSIPFIYFSPLNYSNDVYNIFIFFSILFTCLGFCIRFYTIATTPKNTSGRNTKKQIAETLNTKGVYSIVQHPLYLGNYLIWLGISLYVYNLYFILFMSLFFWLYYKRIMFAEESFLKSKFGNDYIIWSKNVSSFFPSNFNFIKSPVSFSIKSILRREYSSVLSAIVGYLFIDVLRNYFNTNFIFINQKLVVIAVIFVLLILILRTLKHYTKILNEVDRS